MVRGGKVYSKFYSGEFSNWLRGQYDLSAYQYALDELFNTFVQRYGPLSRRTGTNLVAKLPGGQNSNCRLIPFTVNEDTIYVLEFTNQQMRVITPEGKYVTDDTNNIYTLELPYSSEHLFRLHVAQSSDILFIVHPLFAPRQLSHYGPSNWTIEVMETGDGPYFAENAEEDKKITPSGTTGTITLTASEAMFSEEDVGRLVRLKGDSKWGYCKITAYTDNTHVSAEVKKELDGNAATSVWRLGSFCEAAGYPSAITFHQERLWLGGTKSQPQTIWSSVSSDFTNFAPSDEAGDVLDDSSIVLSMLSDEVNIIQWMKSDVVLNIGTLGAEFKVFTYDAQSVLTPHTAQAQRVTSLGSEAIEPVAMPIGTIFVQRSGRKLRHAIFTSSMLEDETPTDLNIWAPHIAEKGFKHITFQNEPNGILWGVTNDGQLASLTYDPSQKVMGWGRHKIAGKHASVHHLCTVPVKSALQYRVFFVMDREINGEKIRTIEYQTNDPIGTTDQSEMVYTDCSYQYVRYYPITGMTYDDVAGTITITMADEGRMNSLTTRGIEQTEVALPEDGAFIKIAEFTSEEPDIPSTEYEQKTKLSEIFGDRVYKLVRQSFGVYKIVSRYGDALPDEFKNCWNDIKDLGVARVCISTLTNLSNWEGEEVQILADGAVLSSAVVTNGTIDLQNLYGYVNIGLGYRSIIRTLPVAIGTASQEITNMWTMKIIRAFVNIYRSLGFKYGVEMDNLSVEPFRSTREKMDQPTPLVTGIKDITIGDVTENKGQVILVQDQPLPLNVLSIGLKLDVTDV